MADGARFPAANFQSHNQHSSSSFSAESPYLHPKYPGMPPNSFSLQSNQSLSSFVPGNFPQMFPRRDVMHSNLQFPSRFPHNHINLQQEKHPMAVKSPQITRHPLPSGQFINSERQLANSSPNNSLAFPPPGQLPFLQSNSQTMSSDISQMVNSSSSFPSGGPQLSQTNSFQTTIQGSVGPVQHFPETFPPSFTGPITIPPPLTPMQFPPPLPGNLPPVPMLHLPACSANQPQVNAGVTAQETTSQGWINHFLRERGLRKQEKQAEPHSHLKVYLFYLFKPLLQVIKESFSLHMIPQSTWKLSFACWQRLGSISCRFWSCSEHLLVGLTRSWLMLSIGFTL